MDGRNSGKGQCLKSRTAKRHEGCQEEVARRKAAQINTQKKATGADGGGQMSLELTPEEQKADDILGPTALHGVPGGIHVFAGELPTCEASASTSGQASPQQDLSVQEEYLSQQEPSLQDETPGSEEPATRERGTEERQQGRRRTENTCDVFVYDWRGQQPINIRLSVMAVTRRGRPSDRKRRAEALEKKLREQKPQNKKR
ncbi:UNVERIFIED_CONTAM: hypothetical protein FKN15_014207 [Acipenser sinensis]